jgi:translation initiation factor 2B subunit (eIF-2B alpha/beta/delta family)
MFSWSSKLLRRVQKDRGSASSIVRYIAVDIQDKAQAGIMDSADWERFAIDLTKAKPEMAAIFNIANGILLSLSESDFNPRIAEFMKDLLERPDPRKTISRELVMDQDVHWVLTNSYSSTVLEVLKGFHARGDFRVTVAESLPMGEGAMFAEALVSCGMSIEIISDSMVFEWMDKADAFICGADAVGPSGVFNKMGSRSIATAAHLASKRTIVVCDSMKLCPVQIKTNIMKKEPVGKDLHRSTQMFETFPLELLDSVVTENGRLHEKELKELFASWQVDERLLR